MSIVILHQAPTSKHFQRQDRQLLRQKCELLAEVAHNAASSLFIAAFKSDNPGRRQELFVELKDLLHAYLDPHIGDRFIPMIA